MAENEEAFLDEEEGIIELEDEEGNVTRFEFVDRAEINGTVYYALIPADYDEEEGASEFVVLKEAMIDGEAMLSTVDDDEEYNSVGEVFLQRFSELPELDIEDLEKLDGADE
ncbi:MAG: DUF1292 domain-containing protein [Lachnospiraceae bacterium]|nr:DUF1292 domain-containing protein [Ruminococcus sp.]MCM1275147.1 DUF1292 domain-containing protein [Lachnospiraceae bacterium]